VCAKKIDDDCPRYPTATLRFWKLDAEALADQEKGHSTDSTAELRFAAIQLDPCCMWRRSHRLGKVAERIGAMPQIGFHAIPQQAWKELAISPSTHSIDPVFDLTLVNDAAKTRVMSSVGFEALHVWSDLKGLSGVQKVKVIDGYALAVVPISVGVPQMLQLPDPIAIPSGHPVRIKLALVGFRPNLHGNESLVRLLVIADGLTHRSRLFNLGVY
jgi:hypothetical protein